MKIKTFMLTFAIAGTVLAGCDKDNDGIKVDQSIENAFLSKYPNASRAEWEMKSNYYVVDFRQNGNDAEAWYDSQAVWYMTETDVRYVDLPQAVKEAFQSSEYSNWRIDDIDMLECLDMETVYIVEVEQSNVDYDLYFSPEGVLIKAVADGGSGGYLPSTILPVIKEYIATNYPQARIVDVDNEYSKIEVDIVDGRIPRELTFTTAGEWISTKTEVRLTDVPAAVRDAYSTSEYGSWKIDDVDFYETATGNYYLLELESGNREHKMKIDIDGNIL